MTGSPTLGLRGAVGLMPIGLTLIAPVLFRIGPVTLGMFMLGSLLTVMGLVAAAAPLPRLLREHSEEPGVPGTGA